jgi:hypothetical protein
MSSDPQNLGLGELGQRVQAMSDPVTNPRLRPYQGAPQPIVPVSNGRPTPSYDSYEEFRVTPVPQQPPQPTPITSTPSSNPYSNQVLGRAPAPIPAPATASTPASTPASRPAPASAWENVAAPGNEATPEFRPAPAAGATAQPYSTQPYSAQPGNLPAAAPPADPNAPPSGLQRAINAVRSTLPLVQRLLPLLDGNFATAIGALVGPHIHPHLTSQPQTQIQPVQQPIQPIQIDLEPVERGLAEVRNSHRELRGQVLEQVTTLKRVEDQLERVREATDRNTLEQQELVEDLRSVGSRVSLFAIVGLVLLAISLLVNVYFLVQLQHILR